MRTFYRKIHSSKIENVGFEPRLCVPGAVCCHYTTFSMTILTGCCVPFGTRSATTKPVGETEPGLRSASVVAEPTSPGRRATPDLQRPSERQSGVLTFILSEPKDGSDNRFPASFGGLFFNSCFTAVEKAYYRTLLWFLLQVDRRMPARLPAI